MVGAGVGVLEDEAAAICADVVVEEVVRAGVGTAVVVVLLDVVCTAVVVVLLDVVGTAVVVVGAGVVELVVVGLRHATPLFIESTISEAEFKSRYWSTTISPAMSASMYTEVEGGLLLPTVTTEAVLSLAATEAVDDAGTLSLTRNSITCVDASYLAMISSHVSCAMS